MVDTTSALETGLHALCVAYASDVVELMRAQTEDIRLAYYDPRFHDEADDYGLDHIVGYASMQGNCPLATLLFDRAYAVLTSCGVIAADRQLAVRVEWERTLLAVLVPSATYSFIRSIDHRDHHHQIMQQADKVTAHLDTLNCAVDVDTMRAILDGITGTPVLPAESRSR